MIFLYINYVNLLLSVLISLFRQLLCICTIIFEFFLSAFMSFYQFPFYCFFFFSKYLVIVLDIL